MNGRPLWPPPLRVVVIVVASIVVAFLAFGCSCRPTAAAPWTRGTFRRQTAADPSTMPGWPGGWFYEWTLAEGTDARGNPYRFAEGGYGATPEDAYRTATLDAEANLEALRAAASP